MFSLLPAIVALLFLAYGAYVLHARGVSRLSLTFFLLCTTTFFWQSCWAVLFQLRDQDEAYAIVKLGYLLILFLPTSLYHFVTELTGARAERRWVALSYLVAASLAGLLLGSELMVDGMYRYFFGFYPRAGLLHPLHVLQTATVVLRGLYLLYRRQQVACGTEQLQLRYCLLSMAIYFFAAVDYLCNYGLALYPPGVLFIAASLGLTARAMVRHQLLAAPLPVPRPAAPPPDYLASLAGQVDADLARSSLMVDMLLAPAGPGALARHGFAIHSVRQCVDEALARFPFAPHTRAQIRLRAGADFTFFGSDELLVYVLHKLFRHALQAIADAGRGEAEIEIVASGASRQVRVTDTGARPHGSNPFEHAQPDDGNGMGLAFCQRALSAFGGRMECESAPGRYTRFSLLFPA